jgi:acyl-CoA reductase-like NAD-dependent aldehyde dehydrogenase
MIIRGLAAQRSWAALSSRERGVALHAAAAKVAEYAEELADAVSREQGKPLNGPGARLEVDACQEWLHTNADLEYT